MDHESYVAIETPIGQLRGRDTIFLEQEDYRGEERRFSLHGRIPGEHASRAHPVWYLFDLTFHGVLALRIIELDSWFHMGLSLVSQSQFDEVLNSSWLSQLGGKVEPHHRHFSVVTYDDAFDVICERYEMAVRTENGQPVAPA